MSIDRVQAYNDRRHLDAERQKARKKARRGLSNPFKEKVAAEHDCRNPDCIRTRAYHYLHRHHIVHRSLLGKNHPERDHPDNGMALCNECHIGHHSGKIRIPRTALSEAEVAFAVRHMGEDWVSRHYPEKVANARLRVRRGWTSQAEEAGKAAAIERQRGLDVP